jgi:hypothetical protein
MVAFYSVLAGAVMRWLGVQTSDVVGQVFLPGALAAGLFAGMAVVGFRLPGHGQWLVFGSKVACLGAAYAAMAWMLLFYRVGGAKQQGTGRTAPTVVTAAGGSPTGKG